MKVRFELISHFLKFNFPTHTSRGSLTEKTIWLIRCYPAHHSSYFGLGEASPLQGLSPDFHLDYEQELRSILNYLSTLDFPNSPEAVLEFIEHYLPENKPSMRFGVEMAFLDLLHGGKRMLFNNSFSRGEQSIPINGLIWMGKKSFMEKQIREKIENGFTTLKLKIGSLDFETELAIINNIQEKNSHQALTIRVDANGAFPYSEALNKLKRIASLGVHSIEQPIESGHIENLHTLCKKSPLPIALDEELIGHYDIKSKKKLLTYVKPQYIVLKPSLLGGITACRQWIALAEESNIRWWITSMLESNIGLNAIAQFTAEYFISLPQGLGTGKLYQNNVPLPIPMVIKKGFLEMKY